MTRRSVCRSTLSRRLIVRRAWTKVATTTDGKAPAPSDRNNTTKHSHVIFLKYLLWKGRTRTVLVTNGEVCKNAGTTDIWTRNVPTNVGINTYIAKKKKNALLEHERGAMVMTIWTNSENKFSQTYFTHNLSELQQKWSETAYRGKQSTGKGLKKDNFTSNKLVSADYHPNHTEVGAFNISSAAMHHWANVFAHQYVNKILSFLKVDPQTLEETETVFGYEANIRWTNDGRDRMQISALCISRVRSLPRNIHFIQK